MSHELTQVKQIPIEFLQRGKFQTRAEFSKTELQELSDSIKANGLVQPIVVREKSNNNYEIIAGERRWRAAQMAGLANISCIIRKYNDEQAAAVTAVENLNRVDLNPIEEAHAFEKLMLDYNYSHEEIAAAVAKSRSKITNSLRLLSLPLVAKQAIITGELSEGHAKILAGLTPDLAQELALRCVREKISVRKLETLLKTPKVIQSKKNINTVTLERNLSDYLGVPATIQQTASGLRLQLECYDSEVLNGILEKIGFIDEEV